MFYHHLSQGEDDRRNLQNRSARGKRANPETNRSLFDSMLVFRLVDAPEQSNLRGLCLRFGCQSKEPVLGLGPFPIRI